MIKLSDIIRLIATTIDDSAAIREAAARWKEGYRLLVGHLPDEPLQPEDNRVAIGIGFATGEYDLGYVQTREAPIAVRVVAWDRQIDTDGTREDYNGTLAVSDLCHLIAEAVKGITGLGDDLLSATVALDASEWPLVKGTIALSVQWPVALNSEATL
jgi:hypothetical protein